MEEASQCIVCLSTPDTQLPLTSDLFNLTLLKFLAHIQVPVKEHSSTIPEDDLGRSHGRCQGVITRAGVVPFPARDTRIIRVEEQEIRPCTAATTAGNSNDWLAPRHKESERVRRRTRSIAGANQPHSCTSTRAV